MSDRPIRVAVVGCGVVSGILPEVVYPSVRSFGEVVATVDVRLDRASALAARFGPGVVAYGSLEALFASRTVDAVDIRLPHALHASAALAAIDHGLHVLVEKPMSTSVADGMRMVRRARDARVVLAVNENYAFYEPVLAARDLISRGGIGDLLAVRTHRVCDIDGVWLHDGWRRDSPEAGGGVLIDQGCHHVNLVHRTVGSIEAVAATASAMRPGWDGEDSVAISGRLRSGPILQQFFCWGSPTAAPGPEACFFGTEGSIEIHVGYGPETGGARWLPRGERDGTWITSKVSYDVTFADAVADWLAACRGLQAPTMSGADGLADLQVVDAARRSLASGRVERVCHSDSSQEP